MRRKSILFIASLLICTCNQRGANLSQTANSKVSKSPSPKKKALTTALVLIIRDKRCKYLKIIFAYLCQETCFYGLFIAHIVVNLHHQSFCAFLTKPVQRFASKKHHYSKAHFI